MLLRRLVVLPFVALAGSALAQDTTDWETYRNDRDNTVAAYLRTTTGLTLLVRCQQGAFTAFVAGLPEDATETRTLGVAFGDDEIYDREWTNDSGGTSAFADLPAPLARSLREGGQMQLRVPGGGEGGAAVRYVLDLPPSTAAIDQTLTACDRPLVDPRDAELEAVGENGLPTAVVWQRVPQPRFPDTRYARGFAVVSCIAGADGRPRDCVVETEHPHDGRFGKALLDSMGRSRLTNRLNPDQPIPPTHFVVKAPFFVEGYETDEDRERLQASKRAQRERQDD